MTHERPTVTDHPVPTAPSTHADDLPDGADDSFTAEIVEDEHGPVEGDQDATS